MYSIINIFKYSMKSIKMYSNFNIAYFFWPTYNVAWKITTKSLKINNIFVLFKIDNFLAVVRNIYEKKVDFRKIFFQINITIMTVHWGKWRLKSVRKSGICILVWLIEYNNCIIIVIIIIKKIERQIIFLSIFLFLVQNKFKLQ